MLKLLLIFTLLPALELFVLLQIGSQIGVLPTVLLIVVTGITGAWFAKREGLAVLRRIQSSLQGGIPPASQLVEGALVACGGLLLITPGIVTDLMGFIAIFPLTRSRLAPVVLSALMSRFSIPTGPSAPRSTPPRTSVPHTSTSADPKATPFDHPLA